ncbi:MAG: Ribonuclease P protein component [Chlamydiia bacterium]|nr:Ribonuclease P protein component [Chlamydiia bacterium]
MDSAPAWPQKQAETVSIASAERDAKDSASKLLACPTPYSCPADQSPQSSQLQTGAVAPKSSAYPKTMRLSKRNEFAKVRAAETYFKGKSVHIQYRLNESEHPARLGITVSKKYGNAPKRNRFKRLVREGFRTQSSRFPRGLEMNVMPRRHLDQLSLELFLCDMNHLIAHLKQDD